MRGYKTINDFSLQECYDFLHNYENHDSPYADKIQTQYHKLLDQWHKNEQTDFNMCQTIEDFEKYLAQYDQYFYEITYKKHALKGIERLRWLYAL